MKNILFLLTDQWPVGAFSFLGADIPTPNIDRLASEGTVFKNAFTTCPLCTPARGTLLTAKWPHKNGVYDNQSVGYSLQETMSLDQKSWIDEAVRLGYHVGYYGKWHLGSNNPEKRGAHDFDPNLEARSKPYKPQTNDHSYQKTVDNYNKQAEELLRGRAPFWGDSPQPKEKLPPFPSMQKGIKFLDAWAESERDKPFFLTLSSQPPHFPHHLPPEYVKLAKELRTRIELPTNLKDNCDDRPWFHSTPFWGCMDTSPLDEEEWKTVIAYSHAHITMVDEALGLVLDTLDRLNLTDSTTVIFTSDHGDMEGAHNRFDKGAYFYEEVWRIPLIIREPDTLPVKQDAYVSLIDIAETLFALIDSEAPPDQLRQGRNLMPLFGTSKRPSDWPQVAYGVYYRYNGYSFEIRAICDERYKYVWNPQDINELYDLETDPHEMINLANRADTADIESDLHNQLLNWLNEIGDNLPNRLNALLPAGTIIATGEQGP